jgi:uncharacterized membrane protein YpjA
MRKILHSIFSSTWFYVALLIINFFGTLYGFYWYRSQFITTPVYLWPFVPNSPLAVLYFFVVLILMLKRKRSSFWEGLAYFGLIKHGLWTVAIITLYHLAGNYYPENFFLWFGHGSMALQAVLFWYYYGLPLSLGQAAAISGWYIFNDYLDYVVGIYPWVDTAVVSVTVIRNLAVTYTLVLTVLFLCTALKHRYRKLH